MNEQGICILFSIRLVPVNFLCAFWLFREALQLTGMTYQEYFKKTSSDGEVLLGSEQRWGYTNRFFKAYSSDPEKSMHFMKSYAAALLPGLAAVLLLCYTEACFTGEGIRWIPRRRSGFAKSDGRNGRITESIGKKSR